MAALQIFKWDNKADAINIVSEVQIRPFIGAPLSATVKCLWPFTWTS